MTDRDCRHDLGSGIICRQIEATVDADGTESIITAAVAFGDNPEATIDEFLRKTGGRRLTDRETQAFHAFSSNRWNSPWEPKGPPPINHHVPKDPSLN